MQRITRLFILLTMLALVFGGSNSVSVRAAGIWKTVGAEISVVDPWSPGIAMDNGEIFLAYSEMTTHQKITVKKFDGTNWITFGEAATPTYIWDWLSFEVDNQIPFAAYIDDYDAPEGGTPWVIQFNGTSWEVVGGKSPSGGRVYHFYPLMIDNGTLYVAYSYIEANDSITVLKKFDGTNWVDAASPVPASATYFSFAVQNSVPYVAFGDSFSGNNHSNKVTVMKFDGTNWVTIGAPGFSLRDIHEISLAVSKGVPFVAYADGAFVERLTVMKFDGTNWVTLGEPGMSTDSAFKISIEVYNGLPYVAFYDNSSGVTLMKFNGTNWQTLSVPDSNYYFDFMLRNDVPYFAFSYVGEDKVKVFKYDTSTNAPPTDIALSNDRVPQNLPAGSTVGTLTAIDADPNDLHAYSLTCAAPGPDDAFFQIGGGRDDSLQTNAVFDYNVKNSYDICVRADDGDEGVYDKNFTIHVTTVVPSVLGFRSKDVNDGWILESLYAYNGGQVDTSAETIRIGDSAGKLEYRSILSFNTIRLPDNAIITKVTLKLKKQAIVGADPYNSMGKLYVDVRSPCFGLTAGLAKSDFQAKADMVNVGNIPKNFSGDWYRKVWSSDTFFSFINLNGRTQFRLHFAKEDNNNSTADYITFYSGDYATVTDRPMLIVEYYVP